MGRQSMAATAAGVALAALGAVAPCSGLKVEISGVQKVIQMLDDMSATAKQEKNDEEVAFAKFGTWCTHETENLKGDIEKGTESIELLSTEIGQLSSDAKALGEEIAKLSQGRDSFEADLKAAKEQRAKDNKDFLATEQDFSESVDALERAIATLNKQDYDRPGAAAALLQVAASSRLPAKAQDIVNSFLSIMDGDGDSDDAPQAPEANAYEFQSGGVISMLNKLLDEFREKLSTAQKEEMNAKHAFNMVAMDLKDAIENGAKDAQEKTKQKERKIAKKGASEKQLKATTGAKEADEKMLTEVSAECSQKKSSYEEKQQLRAEEIEAIQKATEILKSPDVSGAAEKHLSLAQVSTAASFLQVKKSGAEASEKGIHSQVREFLASESRRLHSKTLSLLADKISADPFAKVKKMIDGMITRLLNEANQDAEHEGFCDTEMGKSKVTRTKLSEDIDSLNAAVDDGKATILALTEEVTTLSKEVGDLEKAMGEASDLRAQEKEKNKVIVEDSQAAQKAVTAATAVLKEFYTKSLAATAFVQSGATPTSGPAARATGNLGLRQQGIKMGSDEWDALANPNFEGTVDKGHKAGQQTFGETYKGQQDKAKFGVLAMLEVILSDFSNLEADTKADEAAAQQSFDQFMTESRRNKATKKQKIEMDESDRAAAEAKLTEDTDELKTTQDKLLAANRYYEKLVPQCVDQGVTWEERVAARQAEINSLKEALEMLSGSDIA